MPNCVSFIGSSCFADKKKLKRVLLSKSLQTIEYRIFCNCIQLEILLFEQEIQIDYIPGIIIQNTNITSITIPKNVAKIQYDAFDSCFTLNKIIVEPGNTVFASEDGVLYTKDFLALKAYPANYSSHYSIRGGCTQICSYAFSHTVLEQITIPLTVNTIESYAFRSTFISSIELPDAVTIISSYTFYECYRYSSIKLSDFVTQLSSYSFSRCNFTEFQVPSNVTKIESFCFSNNINLRNITLSENLETLQGGAFSNCSNSLIVSFPPQSNFAVFNNTFIIDKKQ